MSMITSTLPALLNRLIAPVADNPTVTAFGMGALDEVQLRFDDKGRGTSAGNTVRYESESGLSTVTLVPIPVALVGIEQWPFVPHTWKVTVSLAVNGLDRG